jgi:hypothetical protein
MFLRLSFLNQGSRDIPLGDYRLSASRRFIAPNASRNLAAILVGSIRAVKRGLLSCLSRYIGLRTEWRAERYFGIPAVLLIKLFQKS